MIEEGKKFDDGKPRWSLLPMKSVEEVVKVLTLGAKKYSDNNWKLVDNAQDRYSSALLRHMAAHMSGETHDGESRLPHMAHVACNALFLLELSSRMKLELEIYGSLCSTRVFKVNGIDANSKDFGENEDTSPELAEDYGCHNMQFIPSDPSKEVLEKYGIDKIDYHEIVEKLTEGLSFGGCGCCV